MCANSLLNRFGWYMYVIFGPLLGFWWLRELSAAQFEFPLSLSPMLHQRWIIPRVCLSVALDVRSYDIPLHIPVRSIVHSSAKKTHNTVNWSQFNMQHSTNWGLYYLSSGLEVIIRGTAAQRHHPAQNFEWTQPKPLIIIRVTYRLSRRTNQIRDTVTLYIRLILAVTYNEHIGFLSWIVKNINKYSVVKNIHIISQGRALQPLSNVAEPYY